MNQQARAKMIKVGEKMATDCADAHLHYREQNHPFLADFMARAAKAYRNAVQALKSGTEIEFSMVGDGSEAAQYRIHNDKFDQTYVTTYRIIGLYDVQRYKANLSVCGNIPAVAAMIELYQGAHLREVNDAQWVHGR